MQAQEKINGLDREPNTIRNSQKMGTPKAAQSFFQQHAVSLGAALVTLVITFAGMQFQINSLTEKNKELIEKHKEDKLELMRIMTSDKAEIKKEVADASAIAISARGEAKFSSGILLGRGIISSNDLQQYQQNQNKGN